jgi:hypothetical protein
MCDPVLHGILHESRKKKKSRRYYYLKYDNITLIYTYLCRILPGCNARAILARMPSYPATHAGMHAKSSICNVNVLRRARSHTLSQQLPASRAAERVPGGDG